MVLMELMVPTCATFSFGRDVKVKAEWRSFSGKISVEPNLDTSGPAGFFRILAVAGSGKIP